MTPEDARALMQAGIAFRGARDFLLAHQILGARRLLPEVRAGRAPWPMQAHAVCAAFALELMFKARLLLDRSLVPKGAKGHSYVAMFDCLSAAAKADLVAVLHINDAAATEATVRGALEEMEGVFEGWRYLHEMNERRRPTPFSEASYDVFAHALHDLIIKARPDFEPWPGVIWDGNSHLAS